MLQEAGRPELERSEAWPRVAEQQELEQPVAGRLAVALQEVWPPQVSVSVLLPLPP